MFADNENPSDKKPDYENLEKYDTLKLRFPKVYLPNEHISTDEVTDFYKGKAVLRQYIQKHKHFGIMF
jgi:hypothetical protein